MVALKDNSRMSQQSCVISWFMFHHVCNKRKEMPLLVEPWFTADSGHFEFFLKKEKKNLCLHLKIVGLNIQKPSN